MTDWDKILFFKSYEFDSPDLIGSGEFMCSDTIRMLDEARMMSGIPWKINSGYRTKEHNRRVGGVYNSSHLNGYAADISVANNEERMIIQTCLIKVGFDRLGMGNGFIHADNDPDKNSPRSWLYTKRSFVASFFHEQNDR